MVELCNRLIDAANKVELHINPKKYIKVSREQGNNPSTNTIMIGQYKIKKVRQFKNLGTIVTKKNDCQAEIQQSIQIENKYFYALGNLLSSRVLLKHI